MDFPRISAVVMTHPERIRYAKDVCDSCPRLGFEIVSDPDPSGRPSACRTAALAWRAADRAATHHLVVQDDILLCEDFADEIVACVQAMPVAALAFFAHWGSRLGSATRLAALSGLSWTKIVGNYMPTVAMILPAGAAQDLAESLGKSDNKHDDEVAREYLSAAGLDAYLSVPNLVEHLELPSLAANDFRGIRHAACFVQSNPKPAGWGTEVLSPVALPYIHDDTGESTCYIPDGPQGIGGHYIPADTALSQRGAVIGEVYDALRRLLDNQRWARELADRMDSSLLSGLWASAYLLGVLTVETRGGRNADSGEFARDPSALLAQPAVATALSTMAPGMFRNLISTAELTELRPELTRFVAGSVDRGLRAEPAEGGRRRPSGTA